MKVLAIDPGYDRMGIAVLEKKEGKEYVLFSDTLESDRKMDFKERLYFLLQEVEKIIDKYSVNFFAIEKLFFNTNQKTATSVSEVRGALIYLALKKGLEVYEYTPLQIKVAITGYGRADKKQVLFMLEKLVKIEKKIKYDDEFDAIACALTFFATDGR